MNFMNSMKWKKQRLQITSGTISNNRIDGGPRGCRRSAVHDAPSLGDAIGELPYMEWFSATVTLWVGSLSALSHVVAAANRLTPFCRLLLDSCDLCVAVALDSGCA